MRKFCSEVNSKLATSVVVPAGFEIQSGTIDSHWAEYGLHQVNIKLRDQETPYKMIIRNSESIAITSRGFVLIPNEVVQEAADAAAKKLGAVPFEEFEGPWFSKADKHVMMNEEKTRMSALYAFNKPVEIKPGDSIHVGFSVNNGIDGGAAFGTGLFTFRNACANMFIMSRMRAGQGMNVGVSRFGARDKNGQFFDDREVLTSLNQIHFGKHAIDLMVGVDKMIPIMEQVVKSGLVVVDRLRRMTEIKLTEEKAAKLQALPVKYLEKISGFQVTRQTNEKGLPAKSIVEFKEGPTEYQVWNDITQLLTHDEKGHWDTKMSQYQIVQKVLFAPEKKAEDQ